MLPRPRIRRGRGGGIRLRLPDDERELLELLCEELRGRVDEEREHPDLRRLFPPAHADDPEAEDAYRGLVRSQLDVGRDPLERVAGRGANLVEAGGLDEPGAQREPQQDVVGRDLPMLGIVGLEPPTPSADLREQLGFLRERVGVGLELREAVQ